MGYTNEILFHDSIQLGASELEPILTSILLQTLAKFFPLSIV